MSMFAVTFAILLLVLFVHIHAEEVNTSVETDESPLIHCKMSFFQYF